MNFQYDESTCLEFDSATDADNVYDDNDDNDAEAEMNMDHNVPSAARFWLVVGRVNTIFLGYYYIINWPYRSYQCTNADLKREPFFLGHHVHAK